MPGLFERDKVRYKSLGRRRYQYLDESDGLVADVEQVQGGKPRGRLARMFAPERDNSNVVLRVASPDGDVLFTISRMVAGAGLDGGIFLYSAHGAMVGRVVSEPLLSGARIMQNRWQLMDPNGAVQCDAVQRLLSKGGKRPGSPPVHSDKIDYANTYGTKIALFDGKWMTFERPLPDFLRLLVVASPIAFDLLDGA